MYLNDTILVSKSLQALRSIGAEYQMKGTKSKIAYTTRSCFHIESHPLVRITDDGVILVPLDVPLLMATMDLVSAPMRRFQAFFGQVRYSWNNGQLEEYWITSTRLYTNFAIPEYTFECIRMCYPRSL